MKRVYLWYDMSILNCQKDTKMMKGHKKTSSKGILGGTGFFDENYHVTVSV